MKPLLNPPGFSAWKHEYEKLLSFFAFKFNTRRYGAEKPFKEKFECDHRYDSGKSEQSAGRGLHSSTFWIYISALRGTGGAFWGCLRGVQWVGRGLKGC